MAIAMHDLKAQYAALRELVDERIQRVFDHGQFIMGPEVQELEARLTAFTGATQCITCASGTEALLISLMALGVKPGDEVVTTPFSFIAAAEVIALVGARPVFADIEADTCNLDPRRLERAITSRTRAIMPVSLYGQPPDMDEINAIAASHGIPVIEDAAQSFGAIYRGRRSCNLSTIGCTSFFPTKPLACYGDGGAIFTNDEGLARAMREIRVHGQERRYYHTRIGVGGRMDTIQCAVLLAKLSRFEWEIARRAEIGQRYSRLLGNVQGVGLLEVKPDRSSVYAQYTIRSAERDSLQSSLSARGIPTSLHYPLALHQQPAYAPFAVGEVFPVAEQLAREVISLPMHPDLDESTQREVVNAVRQAVAAAPSEVA